MREDPALIVLTYHEVSGPGGLAVRYPGTDIHVDDFRRHLDWVTQRYPIVSLSEGIKGVRDGSLGSASVAISFDDGRSGIETYAYPVLKDLDIPATAFVNASYLDDEDVNWAIKVLYLQQKGYTSKVRDFFGVEGENLVKQLRLVTDRRVYEGLEWLDRIYREVLGEEKFHFTLGREFLRNERGELLELAHHGYRHIRFSWLTYDEQLSEIEKNQSALEEFENVKPLFAVPYGMNDDWNSDTVRVCEMLGLELLTSSPGANRTRSPEKMIRRLMADRIRPSEFADWFYMNTALGC